MLTRLVLAHVILVPLAIYIFMEDAKHPEWWSCWYQNPYIPIPFCVAIDLFIWGALISMWWKEERMAKGIVLLKEALRLQAEGRHDIAEAAYQQGLRLTGQKRN